MWPFYSRCPVHSVAEVDGREYDYIVLGGGTAGCVLARRLSEDPNRTVLLVERGPIIDSWASHVPLLSADHANGPAYSWDSVGAGTPLKLYSGKAMGGTSKINASLYTRPLPADFDAWEQPGWKWKDIQPLFSKSEKALSHPNASHRGHDGLWSNQRPEGVTFPFVEASVKAAGELGISYAHESNDPTTPATSCHRLDVTVNANGRRQATFDAFLPSAFTWSRKQNLHICPNAVVRSLEYESSDDGLRVVGVRLESENLSFKSGRTFLVRARKEVILCAGAIATPQILLLSGIGPAEHLRSMGITPHVDLPGVGSTFQDHLGVSLIYAARKEETVYRLFHPLVFLWELLKYLVTSRGYFLAPFAQVAIFAVSSLLGEDMRVRQSSEAGYSDLPDIEILPMAVGASHHDFHADLSPQNLGAVSLYCQILRPLSAGTVRLRSLDPRERPFCDINAFHDPTDAATMRTALRLALALADNVRERGYEMRDLQVPVDASDAALDAFTAAHLRSIYHYASSCRMLPLAEGGVVDSELRVYGVRGLRIADASIFPVMPACHLQAPIVMVAEKCAELVLNETS